MARFPVSTLPTGRHPNAEAEVVPRIGCSPTEAARSLGVGRTFFFEHVLPELRIVRRGRKRIIPVGELERWVERNCSALALAKGVTR
jgi:hypothetical protein